jgi:hypothetical protein
MTLMEEENDSIIQTKLKRSREKLFAMKTQVVLENQAENPPPPYTLMDTTQHSAPNSSIDNFL